MKVIAVDLPYPKIGELNADAKTAAVISKNYAGSHGELNAILQYVYHSFYFGKYGDETTAEILMGIAVSEMRHLKILGELILRLGADPVFAAPCTPFEYSFYSAASVTYSKTPKKMLLDDISGEMLAVSEYESALACINNEEVGAVITRIKLDEELHAHVLKERLRDYT